MLRRIPSIAIAAFLTATALARIGSASDIFSFSLLPSDGFISGAPGATVGWGYSLTNESTTDWLLGSALISDSFAFGTPNSLFDFPDLPPSTTVSVPFDSANDLGLYELTWDSDAPNGYTNFGLFTLSAGWWNGDPFNGGTFIQGAPDATQSYFAVVSNETVSTPEPRTAVPLFLVYIAGLIWWRRWGEIEKRRG